MEEDTAIQHSLGFGGNLALSPCRCCPRSCAADRTAGTAGVCRIGAGFEVASVCVHRGEEPVISGRRGIVNVFFRGCNLRCVYCQNFQISRVTPGTVSRDSDPDELIKSIETLLDSGHKAVGFVSPSHCLPQTLQIMGRLSGRVPRPRFVYNTNAYDRAEAIRLFDGKIDVYLPDLKYMDETLGRELSGAPDYPEIATSAIREMYYQMGANLLLDDDDEAERGLIIRHLVLPGYIENSRRVLRWIADELSPSVHVSLMAQYYPTPHVRNHPHLGRTLRADEYAEVVDEFERLGFYRGWVQELESRDHYRPNFDLDHPFETVALGEGEA